MVISETISCEGCGNAVARMRAHEAGGRQLCGSCYSEVGATTRAAVAGGAAGAIERPGAESWRETTCILIGALALLVGSYMLLNPEAPAGAGRELRELGLPAVANLHKLFVAQTLCVVGAIFVAVRIRPR